jgi:hypothetical protein
MNSYLKKSIYFIAVCFICSSLVFVISCAGSKSNNFQSKIQTMSDNDLLIYYQGINNRIKDIDSDIKREEGQDQTEQERVISNMPFFFGAEGNDLVQKRRMILKELNRRNLMP